jgi:hypothetical protein
MNTFEKLAVTTSVRFGEAVNFDPAIAARSGGVSLSLTIDVALF